jgi:hypothetical protein
LKTCGFLHFIEFFVFLLFLLSLLKGCFSFILLIHRDKVRNIIISASYGNVPYGKLGGDEQLLGFVRSYGIEAILKALPRGALKCSGKAAL